MKYSFDSCVRFSEVGEDQKLTLGSVINYFQDCSTFQSESLGAGVEFLRKQHRVWVSSSWQVVIERYPALCEKIRITTWLMVLSAFWEIEILQWKMKLEMWLLMLIPSGLI